MTDDVTEEDVLALHLLWWMSCQSGVTRFPQWGIDTPTLPWDVARSRGLGFGTLEAIADAERRLVVQKAEREVLAAVERWDCAINDPMASVALRRANARLRAARLALGAVR